VIEISPGDESRVMVERDLEPARGPGDAFDLCGEEEKKAGLIGWQEL